MIDDPVSAVDCDQVWTKIYQRDFRQWRGIPDECGYRSFDQAFTRVSDHYGIGRLGSGAREYRYRVYLHEAYAGDLKAWYENDDLVLVEGAYPAPHPFDATWFAGLGEPDLRLDYRLDQMPVQRGAWVYAESGLALFMDATGRSVMAVALFSSCTPAYYQGNLHPVSELAEQ
ncbi:MAG: hypothetical protein WBN02_14485 [Sedimenticolaceae bacterium]